MRYWKPVAFSVLVIGCLAAGAAATVEPEEASAAICCEAGCERNYNRCVTRCNGNATCEADCWLPYNICYNSCDPDC